MMWGEVWAEGGGGCIRREGTSEAARSGWTGGWRGLPKRLGAVTVGYKWHLTAVRGNEQCPDCPLGGLLRGPWAAGTYLHAKVPLGRHRTAQSLTGAQKR